MIFRVLHGQRWKKVTISANASTLSRSQEQESFRNSLHCIIDSYIKSPKFDEAPEVVTWIKKIYDHNLVKGKNNRGLATVYAYEILERPENITEEKMKVARILGWCIEMYHTYLVITDDIMDRSSTRRGVPCWYRLPYVGVDSAINDSVLVYSSVFEILRMKFRQLPEYQDIFHRFKEASLLTAIGQYLDHTMAKRKKNDYSMFTMQHYETIAKYKTSFYTFWLPVDLGFLLANATNETVIGRSKEICFEIGKLYQMQDDYIDCYSDASVSGKIGTDIQEGKCTWLAVTALQHFNPVQRELFQKFYGSANREHVQKIKWLYNEVALPQIYRDKERACYNNIVCQAEERTIDQRSRQQRSRIHLTSFRHSDLTRNYDDYVRSESATISHEG
ncbi:farnesyl pyrophosphate synthase-like [Hyposmocoma kahamanoa]|uniref:farnesyl pyrophosphate synthase-like n=1 Tax=Hyposmocoma kahamanoa TaxID=1477025 RepID=UPI000E6D8572|nr:farnesyl pyrophosphate synthase-like [Hyposmocoma kahamanoa]